MRAAFVLFVEDDRGPLFREYLEDLEEGKRTAQELADREGFPFFIFSLNEARRLCRFEPRLHTSAGTGPARPDFRRPPAKTRRFSGDDALSHGV